MIREAAAAQKMSFMTYMVSGNDVTSIAILLEDSAALVGLGIAGASIAATHFSGLTAFDSMGSIFIGNLLGGVAVFLIKKNRALLLGKAPPTEETSSVVQILCNSLSNANMLSLQ